MNDSAMKKTGFIVLACMFAVSLMFPACYAGAESSGKKASSSVAVVTFDIDTGKVKSVTDGNGNPADETILKKEGDFLLNNKSVHFIQDYTVILTHSSPGCFTYVYNGTAYTVCM